jgi:hypothetical protein
MDDFLLRNFFVKQPLHRPKCVRASYQLRVACVILLVSVLIATVLLITVQSNEARAISVRQKSSDTPSGNPQNGKLIFTSQGCNKCHGSEGEGSSTPSQKGGMPRIASTTLALPAFIQLVRKPLGQMPVRQSASVRFGIG